jgi:hypothetical protein
MTPNESMCSSSSGAASSGRTIDTDPSSMTVISGNETITPTSPVTSALGAPQVIEAAMPMTVLPSASGNQPSSWETISAASPSGSSGNRIASTAPLRRPAAIASASAVRLRQRRPPTPERKNPKPRGMLGKVAKMLAKSAQPSGSSGSRVSTTTIAPRLTTGKASASAPV